MQITKLCLLTIVDRFNAKATGSMLGNGVIAEVTNTIEEDAIGYYGVIVNGYYYMSPQLELYFVQNSLLVPVELQLLPDNIVEKYDLVALLDQLEVYLDSVINGQTPPNPQIGRAIMDCLSLAPLMSKDLLDQHERNRTIVTKMANLIQASLK